MGKSNPLKKLNDKHYLFIDEYLCNGLNSVRAYQKIYEASEMCCKASGPRLVNDPLVKEEIDRRLDTIAKKKGLTMEMLICNMRDMAEIDIAAIYEAMIIVHEEGYMRLDMSGLSDIQRKQIKEINFDPRSGKLQLKVHDAAQMLQVLYKYLGYDVVQEQKVSNTIIWQEEKTYINKMEDNDE